MLNQSQQSTNSPSSVEVFSAKELNSGKQFKTSKLKMRRNIHIGQISPWSYFIRKGILLCLSRFTKEAPGSPDDLISGLCFCCWQEFCCRGTPTVHRAARQLWRITTRPTLHEQTNEPFRSFQSRLQPPDIQANWIPDLYIYLNQIKWVKSNSLGDFKASNRLSEAVRIDVRLPAASAAPKHRITV